MATKPLRKYIICSSQRSGSKLYCQLLKMTGVLGAPSEFLVLSKVEARAAEAGENDLARIVLGRLAEKASPSGIAGVKLHFHEFSALTGRVPLESFGGFDVWLDEGASGRLDLTSNHGALNVPLAEVGARDVVLEAGGLERRIRVFRLPDENPHREMRQTVRVPLGASGDNPLWICVTTEDGFQAWSSPIFVFR